MHSEERLICIRIAGFILNAFVDFKMYDENI